MKLNKIFSSAVACALVGAYVPFSEYSFPNSIIANADDSSLGDVNNDGKIDSSDTSAILIEYSLMQTGGNSSLNDSQKKSADVNKDGKIDSTDASLILMYYSHLSTGGTMTLEEFLKSSNSPDISDIPLISVIDETDYFYFEKSRGVVAKVDGYFGIYGGELGETFESCTLYKMSADEVLDFVPIDAECNLILVYSENGKDVTKSFEVMPSDEEIIVDLPTTLEVNCTLLSTDNTSAVFNFHAVDTDPSGGIYIFSIYKDDGEGNWRFYDDPEDAIPDFRASEINYDYTFRENGVYYVLFTSTKQEQNVTTVTVGNIKTDVVIDDPFYDDKAPQLTITTDSGTGLSPLTPFKIYVTADEICDICIANQYTYDTMEAVGTVQSNDVYEILAFDKSGNKTVEYVTVTAYGDGKLPGDYDPSTPGNMNPLNPDNKDSFWEDAANGIFNGT